MGRRQKKAHSVTTVTLDTGCSGGIVALHQAVLGLRAREADMAVVSGCNLMLSPDQFKTFSSMGMVSPDGISYTFDSRANGYGRGEGVGTLVIKRLRYGVSFSSAPTYLGLSNA